MILRVWFPLPLYRVYDHLPRFALSCPLAIALCAALFAEKRAVPPNWHDCVGAAVLLWDQLTCWCSHHSLVLCGSLSSSLTMRQTAFVSVRLKISNSHFSKPFLMSSSFNLPFWDGGPPHFEIQF
jgi:hypothetical protein